MFGTRKEVEEQNRDFTIKVEAARVTKNDNIVMVDLDVNGVKIKSCMLKEITVTKDGPKYKKGDKCLVLNFPSEKVGDKYYNRVWFPISNENIKDIAKQVESIL